MKKHIQTFAVTLVAVTVVSFEWTSHAAITGQWEFNDPANRLGAVIGRSLEYFDGVGGQTQTNTQFGSTTSFNIPNIGGTAAQVMFFPQMKETMGYEMFHGVPANGGGILANQWTLIMDVLFPTNSTSKWRALIQTDEANPLNDDAEFYINTANGLGIDGTYQGNVPANTWVRLAIAVDMSSSSNRIVKYINGVRVGAQNIGGPDGRFALNPAPDGFAILFNDGYGFGGGGPYTAPGYVNSIQIHDVQLGNGYIATLGGPSASGIPTNVQVRAFVKSITPAAGQNNSAPDLFFNAVLQDGVNQVITNSISLSLNGTNVATTITAAAGATTVAFQTPGLFPPGSTNKYVLLFRDNAVPANSYTNEVQFTVARYVDIKLPAPIYLENFDSTPEGQLPAGWTQTNFTTTIDPSDFSLDHLGSAAYAGWLVVDASRFAGELGTYGNPNDRTTDYQRVLSVNPLNVVNGQFVKNLANGRMLFGNSGYHQGGGSQVLYVFTRDFDLTGKTNVFLSFHSLWEQNQDSIGAVEFSTDQGQTWLPIVYLLDGPDVVRDAGGSIDAVATFSTTRGDIAKYTDPVSGELLGGNYGAFIGVTSNLWSTLSPFISTRVDDDPVESKRVELFRLAAADNKSKVRFRLAHAGTDSWYFGVDDFGLYSITAVAPPSISAQPLSAAAVAGNPITFSVQASGTPTLVYQWFRDNQPLNAATNAAFSIEAVQASDAGSYSVRVSNEGGSTNSVAAMLTIAPRPPAVVGVWNFDNANLDISAGVGTLDYADGAVTKGLTTFGSTDGTTVPHIGGQPAKFMRVPAFTGRTNGYSLTMPAPPNGGGGYVNQYTIIWDLLLPTDVNWTALFNTDPENSSGNDADFYISDTGGLGIGALGYSTNGTIQSGTWYRIAFAANLAIGKVSYYVNGNPVRVRTGGPLLDGRFALSSNQDAGPDIRLFNEGDTSGDYTHEVFLNSLLFTDRTMTDAEIKTLGGPSAAGIPANISTSLTLAASRQGTTLMLSWSGAPGTKLQKTASLTNAIWQDVPGSDGASNATETISGSSAFYRLIKL